MTTVESLYAAESFPSPLLRAAEVFGDAVFVCPSQKFSQVRSLVPGLTDYRYRFNYSSPTSTLLAAHGSEISFVYNSATATPASLAKLMSTLWVSFAITGGDPNAKTPSSFSTPPG
ncbi:hypothetical protein BC829DRAFT_412555 [Chytridium lagenaria]|nr:hypothetical protein BC829DRAFT_412555 [Chytridium lagenaria]